jgi:hypothetical protein
MGKRKTGNFGGMCQILVTQLRTALNKWCGLPCRCGAQLFLDGLRMIFRRPRQVGKECSSLTNSVFILPAPASLRLDVNTRKRNEMCCNKAIGQTRMWMTLVMLGGISLVSTNHWHSPGVVFRIFFRMLAMVSRLLLVVPIIVDQA